MRYEFKSSFDRSVGRLDRARRGRVIEAVEAIVDFFEGGPRPDGLGLKQLRKPFWEVRASIRDTVVFAIEKDRFVFLLAGDHEETRRFLRSV